MKDIKYKIMEKIKKNEVKMKPKWWFVAKMEAMKGFTVVMLLTGTLAWAMMVYRAEIDTPIELFDYGELGREIVFLDFPYVFLVSGVILAIGSGILFLKIGDNYKKNVKVVLGITTLVLIGLTIAATLIRKLGLL
jgi:hypothetical protein